MKAYQYGLIRNEITFVHYFLNNKQEIISMSNYRV